MNIFEKYVRSVLRRTVITAVQDYFVKNDYPDLTIKLSITMANSRTCAKIMPRGPIYTTWESSRRFIFDQDNNLVDIIEFRIWINKGTKELDSVFNFRLWDVYISCNKLGLKDGEILQYDGFPSMNNNTDFDFLKDFESGYYYDDK